MSPHPINSEIGTLPQSLALVIPKLRSGHCYIPQYHKRIGLIEHDWCLCSDSYPYTYSQGSVAHLLLDCPLLADQRRRSYGDKISHKVDKVLYGPLLTKTIDLLKNTNAGRNPMHREPAYDYDVNRQERLNENFQLYIDRRIVEEGGRIHLGCWH